VAKIHLKHTWIDLCTEGILNDEQITEIARPTPKEFIYARKGRGNMELDYIDIDYVITKLNVIFGHDWDAVVKEYKIYFEAAEETVVLLALTVRTTKGTVTKEAFGGSAIKKNKDQNIISVADDLKSAESDALKKAASLLGIGWDVFAGLSRDKSLDKERDATAKEKKEEKKKEETTKKKTTKKADPPPASEKSPMLTKLEKKLADKEYEDPQEYLEWLFTFQKEEEMNFVVYDPAVKKYVFNAMDKDAMRALYNNMAWTFETYEEAATEEDE